MTTMDANSDSRAKLILVVDDDEEIRQLIGEFFVQHGYRVVGAADGAEMDRHMNIERPALVVLDLMLPNEDGLSICRRLRAASGVPIIILSALGDETDRIIGLELGADDYLPKPFSPRELVARVRAVLRRREGKEDHSAGAVYQFAGWSLDPHRRELLSPTGLAVALSWGEYRLLSAFLQSPRRILTRDQLIDLAQGPNSESFDRAIDVQVSRLRKKLAGDGSELILTIRGEGYMFCVRPVLR